jgi:hypothetical protein
MHSESWKTLEKTVANKIGGVRLVRGNDWSQSILDVEHPKFSIDCKWRSSLATVTWFKKLLRDTAKIYPNKYKIPILVIKEKGMRGELVVIDFDTFLALIKPEYLTKQEE